MADFQVDLPPVPVFKPMGQVVYRSKQCVQDMDMDKVRARPPRWMVLDASLSSITIEATAP